MRLKGGEKENDGEKKKGKEEKERKEKATGCSLLFFAVCCCLYRLPHCCYIDALHCRRRQLPLQGKKKKGSKKGSKKGKKGAGLSDAQPKLSVPERFIKFQLDTRAEVMGIWCVGSTISAGYWFCVNDHGQHPLCPSLPLPLAAPRPNTIRHHIPLSPTTCPHPFPPALSTLLSRCGPHKD